MHPIRLLRPATLATLLALAGAAQAQGTISSGTTFLQFVGTPFGVATGNANLLFGSTAAFSTEMLYRYGWSYNQGVGSSNRPFSSLDTPVASYVGNVATFNWTNAGAGTVGFARWNATLTVTLTELSPGSGGTVPGAARVDSVLQFRASAANSGAIAFNLFHDLDLDILGSSGAGGDTFRVTDASAISGRAFDSSSDYYAEFVGVGAARYQFASGSTLRTLVGAGGTGSGNLSTPAGTAVADWASTDGAVAFQWSPLLAPDQAVTVSSSFTINAPLAPVPEPAGGALLLAGAGVVLARAQRRRAIPARA